VGESGAKWRTPAKRPGWGACGPRRTVSPTKHLSGPETPGDGTGSLAVAFMGEYQHQLDEKGRLIIPARFREELGSPFVVTRGLDRCLFAFPVAEWANVEAKLRSLPLTQADARAFVRLLMAGASPVELDRAGRALVPPHLRQYAGLQRDVVVLGVGSRVEIWDQAAWESYAAQAQGSFEAIAEKIVGLGL